MMSSINVRYHSPLLLNILCLTFFVYFSKLFDKKEVPKSQNFFERSKAFCYFKFKISSISFL